MTKANFEVIFEHEYDLDQLQNEWVALESKSNGYFFTSWYWMRAWLLSFPIQPILVKIQQSNDCKGMAFLCRSKTIRHKILPVQRLLLNASGNADYDQQWIEYNDILCRPEDYKEVLNAFLSAIGELPEWDEFIVGVSTSKAIKEMSLILKEHPHETWTARAHQIDLSSVRAQSTDFLSTLSKNTRQQIRRSINHYQKRGAISLVHANSTDDALHMFKRIAPYHIGRWGEGHQQSGFANPLFVKFHSQLIEHAFESGVVDIIEIKIAEESIAFFYNFLYHNRVYFYLSALKLETDNKLKPGLVGHALCIQEYMDKGYDFYDLMGGGEPYKDRISTYHDDFFKVAFQRPKIKLKLEDLARKIKQRVKQ